MVFTWLKLCCKIWRHTKRGRTSAIVLLSACPRPLRALFNVASFKLATAVYANSPHVPAELFPQAVYDGSVFVAAGVETGLVAA